MTCDYPTNSPLWSYRKGCRCDRCRSAKSTSGAGRIVKPGHRCRTCGAPCWKPGSRCARCANAPTPVIDRVVDRIAVHPDTQCWIFPGSSSDGYGLVYFNGTGTVAHRVTYESFVGPIPDDLQLDHLCRNRACVNPCHLEPVTPAENVRRSLPYRARSNPSHGTVSRYKSRGCRCDECRAANTAYARTRREAKLLREATA